VGTCHASPGPVTNVAIYLRPTDSRPPRDVVTRVDAHRRDLALVAAALGPPDRRTFIALIARATAHGGHVDIQVASSGTEHTLFATVVAGEYLVEDAMFTVSWPDDELVRLTILRLRVTTLLEGHARWRARHAMPRRAET
jgi:hypothetical protein